MNDDKRIDLDVEAHDANSCMAIGAGLGAFGTAAGMLIGATCPICVVLTPALIGVGAVKRFTIARKQRAQARQSRADQDDTAA